MSVFGVILVRIFSHSKWIRRDASLRIQFKCRKMRTGITSNTDTFQIVNINVNSNNRYKANIPCYCKLCTQKHLDICFFLVAFWCHYPFLSFPGTPVCNLMRNALSSTVAYIFVLLITLMWHGFVDQSSMRNLTRSNLFWLLARNVLNWDGVFWSCLVDFNLISPDPARLFLSKLLIDS